jgi:hypothetical protein
MFLHHGQNRSQGELLIRINSGSNPGKGIIESLNHFEIGKVDWAF